jgi:hypothetical protein
MPNSTVRANAEGLPTLNRRSALAKLGLGLAASTSLAATAIAAPAGVSPELLRLIEAHKAAKADDLQTHRRLFEAHQSYWAIKPEAPGFMDIFAEGPGGGAGSEELPLDMEPGREECKKRVLMNVVARRQFWGRGTLEKYASPQRLKQLARLDKKIEKESLAAIDAYFDKDEAARKSAGMEAASIDCKRAIAAEMAAMQALCSYRCQTPRGNADQGILLGFRRSRRNHCIPALFRAASVVWRGGISPWERRMLSGTPAMHWRRSRTAVWSAFVVRLPSHLMRSGRRSKRRRKPWSGFWSLFWGRP